MINRVRRLPGDRFLILPDNATVAPFEIGAEYLQAGAKAAPE